MAERDGDDGDVLSSGTIGGAKQFVAAKTRTYEIPANSGGAMVSALNKVFAVEPEADLIKIADIDLDEIFDRFRIKSADLTEQSFAAYKSRVRRALTMYRKWLVGEPWKGDTTKARSTSASSSSKSSKRPVGGPSEGRAGAQAPLSGSANPAAAKYGASAGHGHDEQNQLLDYPIALVDSGVTAILRLPRAYTVEDARRMAALINALAVPVPSTST